MRNVLAMVFGLVLGGSLSFITAGCAPVKNIRDYDSTVNEWNRNTYNEMLDYKAREQKWARCGLVKGCA